MPTVPGGKIVVGLIADPGLPLSLALGLKTSIPATLERELDSGMPWEVEVKEFSLPLDDQGEVELNAHSGRLRELNGWDYLVYLTDLPKFENGEPLATGLNAGYGSAVVVLPALGFVRSNRLRRAVVQALASLHGVKDPYLDADGRLDPQADPFSVERRIEPADAGEDAFQTNKGLRGRLLLLVGMVRSNQPWRLVPRLSSAMAAALATGAFGVFYTSIWSMADYLPPQRLATISVLSILVMGSWLVLHNGLWETPVGARHTEKRVVYNVATLATIFLAILLMYLALFAIILVGALVIIDARFLAIELGHDVGFGEYVNLSWLASSLGTIAGAVGSSLDDEQSVRKATFSRREYDRRQITLDEDTEHEAARDD
ncbi:hypothetical protein [Paeniglutamicibacter psychrophenolicus]|uniref:hypothetical protein n=1 Tax=Paeniglutamicibacter psychrophenolicus TaxID=257454 RepID=UPI00278B8F6B|nr:hypothetical protein [Paeniglutamicibacter psychrophenolicus]MDQ0096009.1 hypothetical protein [Paeniglutamicibacter psychrophenolicus]